MNVPGNWSLLFSSDQGTILANLDPVTPGAIDLAGHDGKWTLPGVHGDENGQGGCSILMLDPMLPQESFFFPYTLN